MRFFSRFLAFGIVGATIAGGVGSCSDPVHDAQVAALGPEDSSIPEGEFHRAGQPCLVCHGGLGPAKQKFGLAGTIFAGPSCRVGVDQAEILLIDSLKQTPLSNVVTNCVGNFYVPDDPTFPTFPVEVWVAKPPQLQQMSSHISREGSCGECHKDPQSGSSPGHIYLFNEEPANDAPPQCAYRAAVPTAGCTGGT